MTLAEAVERRHAVPLHFQAPNRSVGAQHAVPACARPKRGCIYVMEYLVRQKDRFLHNEKRAGVVYLLPDSGIVTCLDAKTGDVQYRDRVPGPAKFSASPVAFDNKILLTSEEGDSFVFKAGPTYELLSTNSIGEPVHASPAIAGGRIFIRGDKNLYAIGRAESE